MKKVYNKFLIIFLFLILFSFLFADNGKNFETKNLDLFLYQDNFSLVRESRIIKSQFINNQGNNLFFKIEDIPKNIVFDSFLLNSQGFVLDYFQINSSNVSIFDLKDKELYIKNKNSNLDFQKCYVLNINDNIINYELENKIFTEKMENVILSKEKGFDFFPSLMISGYILNSKNYKKDLNCEISYITNNLFFDTNYNLFINDNSNAKLETFVKVFNNSGRNFNNSNLNIVVSQIDKPENIKNYRGEIFFAKTLVSENSFENSDKYNPKVDTFSVYNIGKINYDILDGTEKNIKFFEIENLKFKENFEIKNNLSLRRYDNPDEKIYAENKIFFKNTSIYDLPKGKIRIFRKQKNDNFIFSGDSFIENSSKNSEIVLKSEKVFTVYAIRKQTEYKDLKNGNYEISWEIKVLNLNEKPIHLDIIEKLFGDWKILDSDCKFEKIDYKTIKFEILVEKNNTKTIKYSFKTKL